ncbi:Nucleotidylyl transferase [Ceratobasidium sp. AG-I]|nr:Nucleotidylyl transferase [Ceratobasidium sp. AG-I]
MGHSASTLLKQPPCYETSLLYLNVNDQTLGSLPSTIRHAVDRTTKRLIVVLVSLDFDYTRQDSLVSKWDWIQKLLVLAYVPAARVTQARNDPLFSTDVILVPSPKKAAEQLSEEKWDVLSYALSLVSTLTHAVVPAPKELADPSHRTVTIDSVDLEDLAIQPPQPNTDIGSLRQSYPVSALGGTFDYLHPGHKILLSMAAWITTTKLIVGITDDSLLVKKANKQYIQPISARIASVRSFVRMFKPSIECDAVPIQDVYGPTGWDPNIQALVVSRETLNGASSVAQLRSEKSLPPLDLFTIDVISSSSVMLPDHDTSMLREAKLSSTHIREWLSRQNETDK